MITFFGIFINVVLLPVFGIVIIGYLVGGRLELQAKTISRAAYYIFVPAYIFQALSTSHISLSDSLKMLCFIAIAHSIAAIICSYGWAHTGERQRDDCCLYHGCGFR